MSELFFDNKHTLRYYRIIERAQKRIKPEGYVEKHHTLPKGIGGKDIKDNQVILTAKEHYICHLLLIKMVKNPKHKRSMAYALFQFRRCNANGEKRFTGAMYEIAKKKLNSLISGINNPFYGKGHLVSGKRNHFYGKHHTKETLQKMSISSLEKCKGEKNGFWRRQHSNKTKKIISDKLRSLIYPCGPYEFISPSGKKYLVTEGLKAFCENHKLVQSNVIEVANKGRKTTRGWMVRYVETDEYKVD